MVEMSVIYEGNLRCRMPAGVDPSKRPMPEKTAHTCPVKQSLHPDVKIEMTIQYPD